MQHVTWIGHAHGHLVQPDNELPSGKVERVSAGGVVWYATARPTKPVRLITCP
jgi:hypothetical protein